MPFICLANANIPDGVLQILDLLPNVSQDNNPTNPPGQNRYLRRPAVDLVRVNTATGAVEGDGGDNNKAGLEGLGAYLVDRVAPTVAGWTAPEVAGGVAAVQALVDTGVAAILADVDAALVAGVGAGVSLTGGASTGTLLELLSVLAGRTYRLPVGAAKGVPGAWDATQRGAFVVANTIFDTQMLAGEIGPVAIGGDTRLDELGGIRPTLDSTAFQVSLNAGQLAQFAAGVTLFPDNDIAPFIATAFQPGPLIGEIANARVVTVYDDDGTLLV